MPEPAVTRVVEDYVTIIWKAQEWPGGSASTSDIATQLGVTPSTVSATLKKLAREGFIAYEPYGDIDLTDSGRSVAVDVVRRHRLIETYLVTQLGVPWDRVHVEADQLEHAISGYVLERMDEALGHPRSDPHGDPIPAPDGSMDVPPTTALSAATPGSRVSVVRVSDRFPEVLRHLQELKIQIGTVLAVTDVNEAADAIAVRVDDDVVHLSLSTAATIRVTVPL